MVAVHDIAAERSLRRGADAASLQQSPCLTERLDSSYVRRTLPTAAAADDAVRPSLADSWTVGVHAGRTVSWDKAAVERAAAALVQSASTSRHSPPHPVDHLPFAPHRTPVVEQSEPEMDASPTTIAHSHHTQQHQTAAGMDGRG